MVELVCLQMWRMQAIKLMIQPHWLETWEEQSQNTKSNQFPKTKSCVSRALVRPGQVRRQQCDTLTQKKEVRQQKKYRINGEWRIVKNFLSSGGNMSSWISLILGLLESLPQLHVAVRIWMSSISVEYAYSLYRSPPRQGTCFLIPWVGANTGHSCFLMYWSLSRTKASNPLFNTSEGVTQSLRD